VKGKRTKVVPARFTEIEYGVLEKLADKRGLGLSPMLRLAFLDYARRSGELTTHVTEDSLGQIKGR
jgi:hypothetical protein